MKRILALLAGLSLVMSMTATADALTLTVSNNGTLWQSILDNGIGDTDSNVGSISYTNTSLSGFSLVKVSAASSATENGGALYTNAFQVSGAPGTVYIKLSDLYNLTLPVSVDYTTKTGLTLQNVGASANLKTFYGDEVFDSINVIADISLTTPGYIGKFNTISSLDNPFSLTEFLTIDNLSGISSQVTASLEVTPVPEPGSMALLGFGMLCLAVCAKRNMTTKRSANEHAGLSA